MDTITPILKLLKPSRFQSKVFWLTVGNIYSNSKLPDLWKQCTLFNPEKVKKWSIEFLNPPIKDRFTQQTLLYYLRQDNPKEYYAYLKETYKSIISKALLPQPQYPIGKLLKVLLGNDFLWCDREWYYFKNGVWQLETTEFSERIERINTELLQLTETKEDAEKIYTEIRNLDLKSFLAWHFQLEYFSFYSNSPASHVFRPEDYVTSDPKAVRAIK